MKTLSGKKAIEQRNLGTVAYKIECTEVRKRVVGRARVRLYIASIGYKMGNKTQNKCC
jgi:hypothetical protein